MLWLSPLLLALVVAGPQPVLHDVRFQTNRHTQVESIWATVPLLLHLTTGFALQVADRARALVILGPGDALGDLGTPAVVAAALVIYWLWWRARHRTEVRGAVLLAGTAGLVLSAAILSKVLSPQYLLWAMPPLALLPLRSRRAIIALVAFYVALPLTQWIYPLHYGDLVRLLLPAPVLLLATRNLLLVLALTALVSSLWALGTRHPA
jgi:hypothetical protein